VKVRLNGQERNLSEGTTLGGLIRTLGLEPSRIAVERNGEVVPKAHYDAVVLSEGDRLEIVHFVGGG
jgi:thiamine biosynthesis protein ThiS